MKKKTRLVLVNPVKQLVFSSDRLLMFNVIDTIMGFFAQNELALMMI